MPHPERAVSENLGNTDGRKLFQQILSSVNQQSPVQTAMAPLVPSSAYVQETAIFILLSFILFKGNSQDSTAVTWNRFFKSLNGEYQLIFKAM
jgi:hypothetical protein